MGRVTARDRKIPLGYRPPEFCLLHATLPATPLPARPRRATVSPTGSVGRWATCHRHVAAPIGGGRVSPAGSGPAPRWGASRTDRSGNGDRFAPERHRRSLPPPRGGCRRRRLGEYESSCTPCNLLGRVSHPRNSQPAATIPRNCSLKIPAGEAQRNFPVPRGHAPLPLPPPTSLVSKGNWLTVVGGGFLFSILSFSKGLRPFETPSQRARAKHDLGGEGAEPPEKLFLEKNFPLPY